MIPEFVLRTLLLFCLSLAVVDATAAHGPPEDIRRVVLLNSTDPHLPAFIALDEALQTTVQESGLTVDFFDESLDLHRFASPGLEEKLVLLLEEKYRDIKVDIVVAYATAALKFAEKYGDEIWPNAAIVFHSVSDAGVLRGRFGNDTAGVPMLPTFGETIDLALELRPGTRRLVVIAGSAETDVRHALQVREALAPYGDGDEVEIQYLNGLSLADTLTAVQSLPPDAVVLYATMFQDGASVPLVPGEVLEMIAAVSPVPVFGIFETYLGRGITAGIISSYAAQGRRAGEIVNRILAGEVPADIGVQVPAPVHCMADWQKMEYWGIPENRLPEGCEVLFKPASAWDQYLWQFAVAFAVILAQLLLIGTLMYGRRRLAKAQLALQNELALRKQVEKDASRLQARLTRFARERSLGVLSTTIVHEVSQPLIAIQNYAQAARRRLGGSSDDTARILELLDKIQGQSERAGAITQRVRSLINNRDAEIMSISVVKLISEVVAALQPDCEALGCHIHFRHDGELPLAMADALQIQLVLVNLLTNALRSIKRRGGSGRVITIDAELLDTGEVQVSVADQGVGISPEQEQHLFEPLYSGGRSGMGVGLAICLDIVDLHGGRIWHQPNPGGGAIFRFTLRSSQP